MSPFGEVNIPGPERHDRQQYEQQHQQRQEGGGGGGEGEGKERSKQRNTKPRGVDLTNDFALLEHAAHHKAIGLQSAVAMRSSPSLLPIDLAFRRQQQQIIFSSPTNRSNEITSQDVEE